MLKNVKIDIIQDGNITTPRGFQAGAVYSGIKQKSKDVQDLSLLYSATTCNTAGVFTTNKLQAAPVIWDREIVKKYAKSRAILINSGCANACTGDQGMINASTSAKWVAERLQLSAEQVLVASTGVIGVQLPMDKIKDGINRISLSSEGGESLTRAIMTTDTKPKKIAVKIKSGQEEFTIGGAAKGAGMIHPNMATMLCFLTTDAAVSPQFLQAALKKAVDTTFNMITVDGDTSTNDTVLILANGAARNTMITAGSKLSKAFQVALGQVCFHLAKSIASDGEGATRLISVIVNGAINNKEARLAARTIASSPLVKTAVHGCDPNWGRIIAAAGRSGAELIPEKSDVFIEDICLLKAGKPLSFDKKAVAALLNQKEVQLRVELNLGQAKAMAWGCDLSEEYVVINSEYTT